MPRLNLSDEETGADGGAPETGRNPMPTGLREVGGGGGDGYHPLSLSFLFLPSSVPVCLH